MNWKDLIASSEDTTKASHTKLWSNVAYAAATVVFLFQAFSDKLTTDVWLIYLAVVGAHTAVSKIVSLKYQKSS